MADVITRFVRSVELIQASAKVLRSDAELLILPVLSGIATLVVGAALVWQAFLSDLFPSMADGEPVGPLSTGFVVWLFAFYFVQYFVIIFFNTALVGAAIARLDGGDPTVSDALALAWSRIGSILGYALISATVGVLLRLIAEKLGFIGRLIEFGAGLAWTVATFLVVPVLAAEGVGPLKAIERSGSLLSETWGENLIGSGGISLVISFVGAAIILLGYGGGTLLVNHRRNRSVGRLFRRGLLFRANRRCAGWLRQGADPRRLRPQGIGYFWSQAGPASDTATRTPTKFARTFRPANVAAKLASVLTTPSNSKPRPEKSPSTAAHSSSPAGAGLRLPSTMYGEPSVGASSPYLLVLQSATRSRTLPTVS
jgi:hypothetical protein